MKQLTDEEIKVAIKATILPEDIEHGHDHLDCIRIAYAWLDAQKLTKKPNTFPTKGLIRSWALRFITYSDIYVAAFMHPDIKISGKKLNISRRYVMPLKSRLDTIGEAGKHPNYFNPNIKYSTVEQLTVPDFM